MVVAGDIDLASIGEAYRLVAAVMAEAQLVCRPTQRQAQDLMAQADPKERRFAEQLAHRPDAVSHRRWIAGAIGEEDAVGLESQCLGGGRRRRNHGDAAATLGQQPQDIALYPEVVGDDMELSLED